MSTEPEFFTALRDLPQCARPHVSRKTSEALDELVDTCRSSGLAGRGSADWLSDLVHFLGDDQDPARLLLATAVHRIAALENSLELERQASMPTKVAIDWGAGAQPMRNIVLGRLGDIEHWRRENHLPLRAVIAVTSSDDLRGYGPGVYRLVTLASWKPSPELAADVREAIRIMEGAGAVIHR